MRKIKVYSDGKIDLPKKYANTYPLKITTAWVKIFIYHKKDALFETQIFYYAPKNKPYMPEGLIKINNDLYQIDIKKTTKRGLII